MPFSRFVKDQKFQHPQEGLNCMQEIHNSNHAFVTLIWACCKANYMLILNLIFVSNLFEPIPRTSLWEANLVLLFQNSRHSFCVFTPWVQKVYVGWLVIACISGCSYKCFCASPTLMCLLPNTLQYNEFLRMETQLNMEMHMNYLQKDNCAHLLKHWRAMNSSYKVLHVRRYYV